MQAEEKLRHAFAENHVLTHSVRSLVRVELAVSRHGSEE